MQRATDAMPAKLADNSEVMFVGESLNRCGNIREKIAGHCSFDRFIEGLFGHAQKVLNLRRNLSDRNRHGRISEEAIKDHAEVQSDHVTVPDDSLRRRNAVNHFIVNRNADARWKTAISLERRLRIPLQRLLFGEPIDLRRS